MRLCSIELLRVILTFLIMTGHFVLLFPEVYNQINPKFFHQTGWGVECFFIIAGFFLYNRIKNSQRDVGALFKGLYWRVAPAFFLGFGNFCVR